MKLRVLEDIIAASFGVAAIFTVAVWGSNHPFVMTGIVLGVTVVRLAVEFYGRREARRA